MGWSCSNKKAEEHVHDEHAEDTASDDWKEMDEFHMIMAEAFHPYKDDSTNLAPAKANAEALAKSAATWQAAPLPHKVDNEEVKAKLEALKTGTAAFVETVKGGDDKAIGAALTKLHDQFHEIQEAWYGGHEHHH